MPERRLGNRERARNAAPMYPARVETRAIAHDTFARMEPRASSEPSKLLRDESSRDPQYSQRPNELVPPHPQSVVGSHERRAGVLVAQDDADESVNRAADAQLDVEAANERVEKAEITVNEI